MSAHNLVHGREEQLLALAEQMPDVELLRLLPKLLHRFSAYAYAWDKTEQALEYLAQELSQDLGYDSAESVFDPTFSFPRVPPVRELSQEFLDECAKHVESLAPVTPDKDRGVWA